MHRARLNTSPALSPPAVSIPAVRRTATAKRKTKATGATPRTSLGSTSRSPTTRSPLAPAATKRRTAAKPRSPAASGAPSPKPKTGARPSTSPLSSADRRSAKPRSPAAPSAAKRSSPAAPAAAKRSSPAAPAAAKRSARQRGSMSPARVRGAGSTTDEDASLAAESALRAIGATPDPRARRALLRDHVRTHGVVGLIVELALRLVPSPAAANAPPPPPPPPPLRASRLGTVPLPATGDFDEGDADLDDFDETAAEAAARAALLAGPGGASAAEAASAIDLAEQWREAIGGSDDAAAAAAADDPATYAQVFDSLVGTAAPAPRGGAPGADGFVDLGSGPFGSPIGVGAGAGGDGGDDDGALALHAAGFVERAQLYGVAAGDEAEAEAGADAPVAPAAPGGAPEPVIALKTTPRGARGDGLSRGPIEGVWAKAQALGFDAAALEEIKETLQETLAEELGDSRPLASQREAVTAQVSALAAQRLAAMGATTGGRYAAAPPPPPPPAETDPAAALESLAVAGGARRVVGGGSLGTAAPGDSALDLLVAAEAAKPAPAAAAQLDGDDDAAAALGLEDGDAAAAGGDLSPLAHAAVGDGGAVSMSPAFASAALNDMVEEGLNAVREQYGQRGSPDDALRSPTDDALRSPTNASLAREGVERLGISVAGSAGSASDDASDDEFNSVGAARFVSPHAASALRHRQEKDNLFLQGVDAELSGDSDELDDEFLNP